MTTPILGLSEISENQSSKYITHNMALRAIEVLLTGVADRRTTASPPGSPAEGDAYIIANASPSGDWADFAEHDIAFYASGWYNITPKEGLILWVADENLRYVFNGAFWVPLGDAVTTTPAPTTTSGPTTTAGPTTAPP